MKAQYYFVEDDPHWIAFFRKHLEYELIPPYGIEHLINTRLAAYDARIIMNGVKDVPGFGESTPTVIGVEFLTEEDRTHFLLKYT